MTNAEAIKELSYIADEMPSMECADWKEAISMAIKALEQEPSKREIEREYLFQSLCEDFKKLQAENDDLRKRLEKEPKEGHWEIIPCGNNHGEYRPPKYACSECGWEIDLCRGLQQDTGHRLFCEHCGAKMVEPQEEELKHG